MSGQGRRSSYEGTDDSLYTCFKEAATKPDFIRYGEGPTAKPAPPKIIAVRELFHQLVRLQPNLSFRKTQIEKVPMRVATDNNVENTWPRKLSDTELLQFSSKTALRFLNMAKHLRDGSRRTPPSRWTHSVWTGSTEAETQVEPGSEDGDSCDDADLQEGAADHDVSELERPADSDFLEDRQVDEDTPLDKAFFDALEALPDITSTKSASSAHGAPGAVEAKPDLTKEWIVGYCRDQRKPWRAEAGKDGVAYKHDYGKIEPPTCPPNDEDTTFCWGNWSE